MISLTLGCIDDQLGYIGDQFDKMSVQLVYIFDQFDDQNRCCINNTSTPARV